MGPSTRIAAPGLSATPEIGVLVAFIGPADCRFPEFSVLALAQRSVCSRGALTGVAVPRVVGNSGDRRACRVHRPSEMPIS
jgi:hypothetical protein